MIFPFDIDPNSGTFKIVGNSEVTLPKWVVRCPIHDQKNERYIIAAGLHAESGIIYFFTSVGIYNLHVSRFSTPPITVIPTNNGDNVLMVNKSGEQLILSADTCIKESKVSALYEKD